MSAARKATIDPRQFVKQGASHRVGTHLPREHQVTLDEAIKAAEASKGKGGRPRIFEGETARLNLHLPPETVKIIRILAVERGVSPSQLVDEWAKRAELEQKQAGK